MEENYKFVYNLDKIREVKFMWDYEYVVFPRNVIKRFECLGKFDKKMLKKYVEWAIIEVDLDYVKSEYAGFGDEKSKDRKVTDLLEGRNTWYIEIETIDEEPQIFDIPAYEKEMLLNEEGINEWNAKNFIEKHEEKDNTYVIEFKVEDSDLILTFSELMKAFKSTRISSCSTGEYLQTEILFRLYDELYNENGKEKEKALLFRLLKRFRPFYERETYSFFGSLRKGYHSEVIDEGKIARFISKNHAYKTEVNFVFISDMNDVNLISNLLPLQDTKYYTSGIVVIYDDGIDLEELIKELGDGVICVSYNKINELWCSIICNWYLGIGDEFKIWQFK